MAGVKFSIVSAAGGNNVGAAGTRKTQLTCSPAANQRVYLKGIRCSGFGTNPALTEVESEINRYTAGTGTSTVATPQKLNGAPETVQSTGATNYTAEPTLLATLRRFTFHNQLAGELLFPYADWVEIAGGGMVGIATTSSLNINADFEMICEE